MKKTGWLALGIALISVLTVPPQAAEANPSRTASGALSNGSAYEVWRMDRSNHHFQLRVWRGNRRAPASPNCTYSFASRSDALTFWEQIANLTGCPYQSGGGTTQNSSTDPAPTTTPSSRGQIPTAITTTPGSNSTSPGQATPQATCNAQEQEQAAVAHLNWMRQNPAAAGRQLGLNLNHVRPQPPLRVHPILTQVARERAVDLGQRRYFSHVDPDGRGPNIKVVEAGYPLPRHWIQRPSSNFIESLVAGRATGQAAMDALIIDAGINPPGHRIHLLAMSDFFQRHTDIGVGFACVPGSPYRYYMAVLTAYPEP
jgi:uncharacterized protein YkwD